MVLPTRRSYEIDLVNRSDGSPAADSIVALALHDLRDPAWDRPDHDVWRWWVEALSMYLADPRDEIGAAIVAGEMRPFE